MNNYCTNCGKELTGSKNFCSECGMSVTRPQGSEPLLVVHSGIGTSGLRIALVIFGIASLILGLTQIYGALVKR